MVTSKIDANVDGVVAAFTAASADRLDEPYRRLIDVAWQDGRGTGAAPAVLRLLTARFAGLGEEHQGRAAVLLGLLLEGADLTAVAAEHCTTYLEAWRRTRNGQPLFFALLYLLAHFPDYRDQVLAAAEQLRPDPDDRSRLERALQRLDPAAPQLGRAFPAPVAWAMDDDERGFDQTWIDALSPAQVRRHWDNDTETVLGYLGAKAHWAVANGTPVPFVPQAGGTRFVEPAPAGSNPHLLLTRHITALRCPHCHGGLAVRSASVVCTGCARTYPIEGGILDLTATAADRSGDFLFRLAEMPAMGYFYETYARPNFLRVCGANWGGRFTPADEDAYIARNVCPVEGPVLDLAAGAGRWTSVLAEAVGADRVIALDLGPPMLAALRERLPEVPAVLAGAAVLPFGDAVLGAVLCWNALQAFPADAPAAIAEVGRCLRPGGTFTLLTFRNSDEPVYRYFVGRHHFPQHVDGLRLFDRPDVVEWITGAGMRIRDEFDHGLFVIITAERT